MFMEAMSKMTNVDLEQKEIMKIIFVGIISIALITMLGYCDDAFARAGGGVGVSGGRGSKSIMATIMGFILLPFFVIYSGIMTYIVAKKNNKCKQLIDEISEQDATWNYREIKSRIEETYFKVQHAWTERNQDLAKEYMSSRLYNKHKIQTDEMLRTGQKNILQKINLKEAKIVEVLDYEDDAKDSFWVLIHGSMIDYTIDENTMEVLSGEKKNNAFKELWRFARHGDTWLLDEIDQDVTISDFRFFQAFSEDSCITNRE